VPTLTKRSCELSAVAHIIRSSITAARIAIAAHAQGAPEAPPQLSSRANAHICRA
jgi:hypothetical protein